MKLDNMILTDFAAAIISSPNANGEQTTRATVISVDENDDKIVTIRIDGSNEDTAATTTVKCEAEDRVMVLLKGHKATVIGNISSPVLKKVTANDIVAGAVTADAITAQNIESDNENSWINFHLGTFNFGEKLIWDGSDLTVRGTLTAGAGSKIGPWMISDDQIYKDVIVGGYEYKPILHAPNTITGSTKAFCVAVKSNGQSWTYPFAVTYDGSLAASKGTIGPWNIDSSNSIWSGNSAYGNANGMYFGTSGISLTNKFKVSAAGALESISGSIGGWNISTDKLYAESTSTAGSTTYRKIHLSSSPYATDLGIQLIERATSSSGNLRFRTIIDYGSIFFRDNVNGRDGSLSASQFMVSGNGGTKISYMDVDGISTTGTVKEGGTALYAKYMGMEVANGYWGLKPNGSNAVYVRTTQNGLIPYKSGGSGTLGTSSWPFSTIYGKTIYENGTALGSKYLGLSGGTVSGAIIANYNGAMIRATNPTNGGVFCGVHASESGYAGVYTNGYWNGSALAGAGRWLIYRSTADTTCVPSELYTHNEGYTTLRPVVGTNAGTNAVGVIVSNSATFGIYGRWAGGATAAMSGRTISCPGSDIRLKENVEDSTIDALSVINAIKIRQFDWKDKSRGHWDCGMVVDEMEKDVDPKFCIGGGEDEDGNISYKCVDTFYLQGYEVKAIQELSARVEELERRLNE